MKPGSKTTKRWIVTALFLVVAIMAASPLSQKIGELPPLKTTDARARAVFDAALVRAGTTYALVRGINGMVSVLQGTTLAFSPAGIGMQVSAGEVLDPVNDLVERFSWIMLLSSTAIGVQRILMEVGSWLGLGPLLSLSMLLFALGCWKETLLGCSVSAMAGRFLVLALAVRFFIPASALLSDVVYQRFMAEEYDRAAESLRQIGDELEQKAPVQTSETPRTSDTPPTDRWKRLLRGGSEWLDWESTLRRLKTALSDITAYVVRLIVVFLVQTVLLPLIWLWLLVKAGRQIARPVEVRSS